MPVSTPEGLLIEAVQDLADSERALDERLGGIAAQAADPALRAILESDRSDAMPRFATLASIARRHGAEPAGAPNIWLRAILDDADRDTRTECPGPLLDIALAGALRKAKQAQRVSLETAAWLALRIGDERGRTALLDLRDAQQGWDDALSKALQRLTAGA